MAISDSGPAVRPPGPPEVRLLPGDVWVGGTVAGAVNEVKAAPSGRPRGRPDQGKLRLELLVPPHVGHSHVARTVNQPPGEATVAEQLDDPSPGELQAPRGFPGLNPGLAVDGDGQRVTARWR